ncbi:hypothetical protein ILUMI_19898 [Ignelater luminosus]|uniref:UDP-glycosyltransferase n=1 Tax=Ignelater luminosus TaxID=2038154 RepID=A0A8K0FZF7_IGNLU|nr:hypothetical protein ILUMI_19898 [Ignelater luminosus]
MGIVVFAILFWFVFVITPTHSARILGIAPIPSFSHQIAFRPIWRELSLRGHHLTVLTTDPMRDTTLANLTEIDMSISYKKWNEENLNELSKLGFFEMMDRAISLIHDLMEEQLLLPEVQKLFKNETEHFDVVMIEFLPAMAAFAERFDCPLIIMYPLDAPTLMYHDLGNPSHPVLNPDVMLASPDKPNFFQRLASSLFIVSMKYYIYEYLTVPSHEALIKKYFGNNYPSLEEILKRTSMLFVNTDMVFHPLRPLLPNIIQFGGGTHMTLAKPLPKIHLSFKTYLNMVNVVLSILLGFMVIITPTHSARILGIAPIPSFSHQIAFRPIWRELSLRGHNVTVLTTDPVRDATLTNLTEIDTSISYKKWNEANLNEVAKLGFFKMMDKFISLCYDVAEEQLLLPEVQKLLKNETEHFDVVIIEFFPSMAAFAERFHCPLILMSSLDAPALMYQILGNPSHPILNPDFMLAFSNKPNFFQRLISSFFTVSMKYIYEYFTKPTQEDLIKKHFGKDYPPLEEILERISMMLTNTDTVFHPLRPLLPNVIQFGGGTHLTPAKPLPKVIPFSITTNSLYSLFSEK